MDISLANAAPVVAENSKGEKCQAVLGIQVLDNDAWMGGTIYVRNLIYAIAGLEPAERPPVRLIGWEHARASLVEELAGFDFVETPAVASRTSSLVRRAIRRLYRGLSGEAASSPYDGIDIVFPALHTGNAGNVRRLFWIPDFQHEHMPEFFPDEELVARRKKDAAIAGADGHLVLSSRMALADYQRLYPDATTTPHVWSFCSTMTAHERGGRDPHDAYGVPRKYLYIPNQFWAHKNHETAFRALKFLSDKGIRVDVVCTGYEKDSRNRDHVAHLKHLIADTGLAGQVHFLGLVPRDDQIKVFRHAAAVLQPSLFEGWSTVIEDAKAIGRPVIASNFPVHREQLGENGTFFSGREAESLAALLEQVWPCLKEGPDPDLEAAAAEEGKRRRVESARAFLKIVQCACQPVALR